MVRIPPAVTWRCAVIALVPVVIWAVHATSGEIVPQRAGGLHYQVRLDPDRDAGCVIMARRYVTPGLRPHLC